METPALFIIGTVVVCVALYGVFYLLLLLTPYLLFYFVPWVMLAGLMGVLLNQLGKKKGEEADYRRSVVGISVLAIVTYFLAGVPEAHQFIPHGKNSQKVVLQWPWAYEAFNSFNQSWREFFSLFLGQSKYESVLFDRNDISVIVWSALLLGGPILFWLLSKRELAKEKEERVLNTQAKVRAEKNFWLEKESQWRDLESKLRAKLEEFHRAYMREKEEKEKLQYVTPQGLTTKALDPARKKTPAGVLDSDLL